MKTLLFPLVLFATVALAQPRATDPKLTVTAHPGTELISVIRYLSGHGQATPSTYLNDVRTYFEPYRQHPAVLKLWKMDGVYFDLTEFGWTFNDALHPTAFALPDSSVWYRFLPKAELTDVLTLCLDFSRKSNFPGFYEQHRAEYGRWGDAYAQKVDSLGVIEKLESFYRSPKATQYYVALEALNGQGAHAVTTRDLAPKFGNYVVYQQGYYDWRNADRKKAPSFDIDYYYIVWHEGSHIYINQALKAQKDQIDALRALLLVRYPALKNKKPGHDWDNFVNEQVVRAVTCALTKQHRSSEIAKTQLADELQQGYMFTEPLARFIGTNYVNTPQTFDLFFPKLVTHWATLQPGQ